MSGTPIPGVREADGFTGMREPHRELAELAPLARTSEFSVFRALVARDLFVLRKQFGILMVRVLIQPLLALFMFGYLFPRVGQQIDSPGVDFSSVLVSGIIGLTIVMQAIQAVALPLMLEITFTREIEDRAMSPASVTTVAVAKIVSGALQSLFAATLTLALALLLPIGFDAKIDPVTLALVVVVGCFLSAALALAIGTSMSPRFVPVLFNIIVLPITFLGAVYYPWEALRSVRWVQVVVLANPLVYLNEGLRAGLTDGPHMTLFVVLPVLVVLAVILGAVGVIGFRRQVVA